MMRGEKSGCALADVFEIEQGKSVQVHLSGKAFGDGVPPVFLSQRNENISGNCFKLMKKGYFCKIQSVSKFNFQQIMADKKAQESLDPEVKIQSAIGNHRELYHAQRTQTAHRADRGLCDCRRLLRL
ncbi:MAG: hypothetical protein ACLR8Y_01450 [Alistipes indistinctus]